MPNVITASLDVTKIEKQRLFPGKKGAKYLNIALIPTTNDRYDNDFMVVQSVTAEEREQGIKGPILGNAKIMAGRSGPPQHRANDRPTAPEKPIDDDSVPF